MFNRMIRWCKYLNSTEFTVFNNYVKKYSIIILWIILGALHNFYFMDYTVSPSKVETLTFLAKQKVFTYISIGIKNI